MKKAICIIVIMMFVILLSGYSLSVNNGDTLLLSRGLEIIERLEEKVKNEEFIKYKSTGVVEAEELIKKIGKRSYSEPSTVYKITFPKGIAASVYKGNNIGKMPDGMKAEVENQILCMMPAQASLSTFMMPSVITSYDCFICKEEVENSLYIYFYENDYIALVSFVKGDENIIFTTACFARCDLMSRTCKTSELKEWLKDVLYIEDCEVKEISVVNDK